MNPTTEQTERTGAAARTPWRSRWYSAAKRGGLTAIASCVVLAALTIVSIFIRWSPGRADLFLLAPVLAAVWGFLRPREYPNRPSAGARTGVALLGATGIAIPAFLVILALVAIGSFDHRVDGDTFTPEIWSFCHDRLHLAQNADLRPAGFRMDGFQEKFVQAKFITGETDPTRLFDTNAVDLCDVRPGGLASNILPQLEKGRARSNNPRWWTPLGEHVVSGSVIYRDLKENVRANCQIAIDALPDGTHALYVFWFYD